LDPRKPESWCDYTMKAKTDRPQAAAGTQPVLALKGVHAGYGQVPVIRDITLYVCPGEVVALLGANGSGKTTTILTMAGELVPRTGTISANGVETKAPLYKRSKAGLRLITEERSVFMSLSVADNLRLAHRDFSHALELFPELKPLMKRKAGLLSGGQQQMLALGRALGPDCKVLLADELSLGLAPVAVDRLLTAVRATASRGVGVVLVEQNLERALRIADRAYVLQRGRIVIEGTAAEIRARRAEVQSSYLTTSTPGTRESPSKSPQSS
jgi:branched-chain amino acid transport system ATP-binding protein